MRPPGTPGGRSPFWRDHPGACQRGEARGRGCRSLDNACRRGLRSGFLGRRIVEYGGIDSDSGGRASPVACRRGFDLALSGFAITASCQANALNPPSCYDVVTRSFPQRRSE